jgi:hypothetical protein
MVLSYHVFDGQKWLADDEHSWTSSYHDAAGFTDAKLAQDIGERECGKDQTIYVMGCMGWQ